MVSVAEAAGKVVEAVSAIEMLHYAHSQPTEHEKNLELLRQDIDAGQFTDEQLTAMCGCTEDHVNVHCPALYRPEPAGHPDDGLTYVVCNRPLDIETPRYCEFDGRVLVSPDGSWPCPWCRALRHGTGT